jgi:HK97 family phage major capsid protein
MNRPLNPIPLRPDYSAVSTAPRGLSFVRAAIATAVAPDEPLAAQKYAEARWGVMSVPSLMVKAAVSAGGTDTWGEDISSVSAVREFFEAVSERSIVGKLAGLRRPPLNVRTVVSTSSSTAFWVGQGAPKPPSKLAFSADVLAPLKVAGLTVVTNEVLRSSDPAAERVIRADMLAAVSRAIDEAFIDETNAGEAGVQPAAVNYGVTPVAGTGDLADDLQLMLASFGGNLEAAYFIAHPVLYASLSGADYPGIGARGGVLVGVPTIASSACSPDVLTLIDPTGIAYGKGRAEVRTGKHATVQMLDNPATGATNTVSLFQTNSVGLLAETEVNWAVVRPGSVAVLTTSSV